MQTTKNRKFPLGNSLLYISLSSVDFGRVRPIQGRPCFCFAFNFLTHDFQLLKYSSGSPFRIKSA